MSQEVREALEQLTAERGEKKGDYYYAEFTVKEVLDRAGMKNILKWQNYVGYVVKRQYAPSRVLPGQGDNGGFVHMKIRSV